MSSSLCEGTRLGSKVRDHHNAVQALMNGHRSVMVVLERTGEKIPAMFAGRPESDRDVAVSSGILKVARESPDH